MLLPGMNCSPRLWSRVEPRLRAAHEHLDVRHHVPARASVDACVAALLATLPSRFALAGLSLGGIVAMALVRQAPDRVSRLCLLSTNPRSPRPDQQATWTAHRAQLASGRSPRDLQRDLLPALLHAPARSAALDEEVLQMADETPTQVLDHQLAAQSTRVDERLGLTAVRVPTLIVAAAEDQLCSLDMHQEIHDAVQASRLVVLDGVGHLSPLEAPDRVAAELVDWLR